MKTRWLIILTSFCTSVLFSSNDTINDLVSFSQIRFNSVFEKKVLEDYFLHHKKDYIGLFLAIDKTQTQERLEKIKTEYQQHLSNFQNKKFEKASDKKKIKLLFTYIHDNYFTQYELITLFNEIYSSRKFNCVTATALYSIYFNDLKIPFNIKENQVHVYLVTYPNTSSILVESTDPQNRVFNYDFRTKNSFVYHLVQNKIISEDLLKQKGLDEVFNRYFYTDENISIDQLIGIQYMNHAAYLLDEKKPKEAFNQLEKAYLFYPNDKHGFILFTALSSIISSSNYKNPEDYSYLFKLPKYKKFNITDDQIEGEFSRATQNILIDEGDESSYEKLFQNFIKCIDDSTSLYKDISFIYHYEMARYNLSQSWLKEGIDHIEAAYQLKPSNTGALSLFIASIAVTLRQEPSQQIYNVLTEYLNKYPALIENDLYHGLLLESYLLMAIQNFEEKKIENGLSFIGKFESSFNNNRLFPVSKELIVQAYASLSVYYFRLGKFNDSKKTLQKGLEYVPGSAELKYRMMSF